MYAVEFEAPIKDGIVEIPKEYSELQNSKNAKFVVIYGDKMVKAKDNVIEELDELFSNSDNKITATMELATNIDELVDDGLF